jgi:uncharacterized protein (TIRG00374 family)
LVHYWLKAIRWSIILRPLGRFSASQVLPAIMIGFAGNNLLPARLGEVIRALVFARRYQQPVSGIAVSLVVERILDVVAILSWYLVALAFGEDIPEELVAAVLLVGAFLGLFSLVILVILLAPRSAMVVWHRLAALLPDKLVGKGDAVLQCAIQGLASLKSPASLLTLLLNSLIQWGLILAMVWICLWTFGISVGLPTVIILLTVLTLAIALPSAPGYIGVVQAAFIFTLTPFGVDSAAALAASVYFVIVQWVPVTVSGVMFFFVTGQELSRIKADLASTREEGGMA